MKQNGNRAAAVALLTERGPMTIHEVATAMGIRVASASAAINNTRTLKPGQFFRVVGIGKSANGNPAAMYAAEAGPDIEGMRQKLNSARKVTEKTTTAREVICMLAARPGGLGATDAAPDSAGSLQYHMPRMAGEGMLIRAERNLTTVRYFVNQANADAYLSGYDAPIKPTAKREKKSTIKAITRLPNALITQTKPTPGLTLKKEPLRIVYPERYRLSINLMPAPRNTTATFSFVHNGHGAMRA